MHIKSLYPPVPPQPETNFHSVLFGKSQIPRDHVLYIDGLTGETRTFGEFYERLRDTATAISAAKADGGLGVRSGPIAVFAPNCLDYCVLIHACLVLAAPFALLPSKPTMAELVYLLKKSQATLLFVHRTVLAQALEAAKETGFPTDNICLFGGRDASSSLPDLDSLISNVKPKKLPRQPVVPATRDTLAYMIFSSGTGGPPKGVMLSHGNMIFSIFSQAISAQERQKIEPPADPSFVAKWICFLPMYHSYGLYYSLFLPLLSLGTLVILPRWNLDQVLDAIPKYKITNLALVPSIVHQLVNSPKTYQTDFSSVRFAGCGGAYLPPELNKRMAEIVGAPIGISEGYGLSEATIGTIGRPPPGLYGLQHDPKCTGILVPGQEARIIREDGSEADFNEPGELLLKGGNLCMGYWQDEKATKDAFTDDHWLRTGDRFRVNKQGVFYYEDRLKDTLKISGAQVAPVEIEIALLAHPEKLISDAVVAGVPGGGRTSDERVPRAWVVLSDAGQAVRSSHGEKEVLDRLESWTKSQLSRYKWLKGGLEVIHEVPKNPTGKVMRRVVVDEYVKRLAGNDGNSAKAKL